MHLEESPPTADVECEVECCQANLVLVRYEVGDGEVLHHRAVAAEGVDVALHRCHEDGAVAQCQHVADERAVAAVLRQLLGRGVVDEQPLPQRSYPYLSVLPSHDVLHRGADDDPILRLLVESAEGVGAAVIDVESKRASKPDVAPVLVEGGDGVVLEARILLHHVSVDGVLRSVEAVQSVVRP